MFFKQYIFKDPYLRIEEKIKFDLLSSLRGIGIGISKIQIDMRPDNINLELCINEKNSIRFVNYD